jgi:hypothetical protein
VSPVRSKEDDEMRSQVGPLHNVSSNVILEVLGALASALAITASMGLALLFLSLMLAS